MMCEKVSQKNHVPCVRKEVRGDSLKPQIGINSRDVERVRTQKNIKISSRYVQHTTLLSRMAEKGLHCVLYRVQRVLTFRTLFAN